MFLLIKDYKDEHYVIRKNDIKRVYSTADRTWITFANKKENPSIRINESVESFFKKFLSVKTKK